MIKIGVESMMVESLEEIMARSEVLVIGNKSDEFMNIFSRLTPDPHVIDLVRIAEALETKVTYEGICW